MEFSLLGAAAIAIAAIYAVLWWEAGRSNAADCTRDVWDSLVSAAVVGIFVGRLVSMLGDGINPLTHPADILIVRGGVDTAAAAVSALGAYVWSVRVDVWGLLDAATPAALAGLAGWHAGCIVRSTCLGTRSDLPWAFPETAGGVTRHPVEIYAALLFLVLTVGLIAWKLLRRPPLGVIAAVGFTGAAGVRLLTEPLRLGLGDGPARWYLLGVVVGAVGVGWRWRMVADRHGSD